MHGPLREQEWRVPRRTTTAACCAEAPKSQRRLANSRTSCRRRPAPTTDHHDLLLYGPRTARVAARAGPRPAPSRRDTLRTARRLLSGVRRGAATYPPVSSARWRMTDLVMPSQGQPGYRCRHERIPAQAPPRRMPRGIRTQRLRNPGSRGSRTAPIGIFATAARAAPSPPAFSTRWCRRTAAPQTRRSAAAAGW